ncbi:uncharacterized protein LOC144448033 isoform X2 [Glandiceps talaboti]
MDIANKRNGQHSADVHKYHGSYSPSLARKLNQAAHSPGSYHKTEYSHSSSPTCGHGFFSLFKKSKKRGSFSYGEMEESPPSSPRGSPVTQRRQKTTPCSSNDADSNQDSGSDTSEPENGSGPQFHLDNSSSDDEDRELAKGEITLFVVPKVICEPPPAGLISILKTQCKITCSIPEEPCDEKKSEDKTVEKSVHDHPHREHGECETEDSEVQPGKNNEQDLQCNTEIKQSEVQKEANKKEVNNGESLRSENDEDKHNIEDDIWQKPEDVPALQKKKVTWDPDVKDPKPRKNTYTAYIEGWHREFLRQQRERRFKYQQMQKKQSEREKYNQYRYNYGCNSMYPTVVPYF